MMQLDYKNRVLLLEKQIEGLKKQLAEKDRQIEALKASNNNSSSYNSAYSPDDLHAFYNPPSQIREAEDRIRNAGILMKYGNYDDGDLYCDLESINEYYEDNQP